ncbi:MAG: hypothetical protein M3384_07755 [Acidobacteriota bacterium]|nr:hypothetical protein [Acidobacteriota bacterium]
MNDIINLRILGEDGYEAVSELTSSLETLSQEQKSKAFRALADLLKAIEVETLSQEQKSRAFCALAELLESLYNDFSQVRRIDQPPPNTEKSERVDVLVNWLREKS